MRKSVEGNFSPVHKLIKKGKFGEAIAELVDASTGRIRSEFAYDRNHAWYCIADSKFRLGDTSSAVVDFKKAYKADPNDVPSLLAIGNCYDALGKPRLAERFLRKALLLEPTGRFKAAVLLTSGTLCLIRSDGLRLWKPLPPPANARTRLGALQRRIEHWPNRG